MSASPENRPEDEWRRQTLGIRGLMVLTATLAVGLAVGRAIPALGVALTFVLLVAQVRTSEGMGRVQAHGRSLGGAGVMRLFLGSVAVAAILLTSSLAAFLACCYLLLWFHPLHFIVGIVAAVAMFRSVRSRTWPIRVRDDEAREMA